MIENPPPEGKCSGAIESIHCTLLLVSLSFVAKNPGYSPFTVSLLILSGCHSLTVSLESFS